MLYLTCCEGSESAPRLITRGESEAALACWPRNATQHRLSTLTGCTAFVSSRRVGVPSISDECIQGRSKSRLAVAGSQPGQPVSHERDWMPCSESTVFQPNLAPRTLILIGAFQNLPACAASRRYPSDSNSAVPHPPTADASSLYRKDPGLDR